MNMISRRHYLSVLGGLLMIEATSIAAIAENINENINNIDRYISVPSFYLSRNYKNSNQTSSLREYTFKAPDSSAVIDTAQSTNIQGYKVEVYGSAEELLQQVQDIEPSAFIKGDIIQVGIFSRQDNAEDLVRKLAVAGFWARIIVQ